MNSPQPSPTPKPGPEPEGDAPIPVVPPHVTAEIFRAALRATGAMLVVLVVLGVGIGALVAGVPGVWGAVLGVAITLLFSGTTILSMMYTADKSPSTTMAVVLGAWIAKMAVLIVIFATVGQMDFYHRTIFAAVVLVGVVGSAALDMYSVIKGREPYTSPR